jgi:hypothetical protein
MMLFTPARSISEVQKKQIKVKYNRASEQGISFFSELGEIKNYLHQT